MLSPSAASGLMSLLPPLNPLGGEHGDGRVFQVAGDHDRDRQGQTAQHFAGVEFGLARQLVRTASQAE